jgi:fructan beta-fructosidase
MRFPVFACASWLLALWMSGALLADERVLFDFDGGSYAGWTVEGDAFGERPAAGGLSGQMAVSGFVGPGLINSYLGGDRSTGTLTSPLFTIEQDYLSFLIGGGELPDKVGVELLVDGRRVRSATGRNSERLEWQAWDVRELAGRQAQLRIFDHATGSWGHVLLDQVQGTPRSLERPMVGRLEEYRQSATYYREMYRPQFHFTPEINWMNDPNGLVYLDGEYHLFYQHNPHGNEWGHMSWGHAVSRDLLHWTHLPIALHEEYGTMIFSGSAVADERNSSGFGVDGGVPPLVAIYTGHGHGKQTQDLAFSRDRGRTWTKYAGNPVIDLNKADFRDPKVFWHAPTQRWIMVVALATEKRIQFYAAADLKRWELLSEFGPAGAVNKPNWECPDLFELPIENEPGQSRWVLEADMGSGSVAGGSGGEYFTGTFDGKQFVADSTQSQWVDFGRDFYAPVSWAGVPESDGRRLWVGWMNNWETALNPTYPWRSAMSVPRELSLRRIDGQLRLVQRPVRELSALRSGTEQWTQRVLADTTQVCNTRGQQLDIQLQFAPGTAATSGIRVLQGGQQFTEIGYDAASQTLYVDRTASGDVGFHPAFAGKHAAPLKPDADGRIQLRILVDTSSVEVFADDGAVVMTDLVFPDPSSDRLELFASGGECTLDHCTIYRLQSVWETK